jgi:hypothetical protein
MVECTATAKLADVVGMNDKGLTVREVKIDPESTPFQPTP